MQLKMFAVYDQKARAFAQPFFAINEPVAVRSFAYAANDPTTDICRYPHDYSLFELGLFDDSTGNVDVHTEPKHLCLALTLVESPTPGGDETNV